MKAYVLDTNAVISYLDDEAGSDRIESILRSAESRSASVFMSAINLGEVFYITWTRKGESEAKRRLKQIIASPISIVPADVSETLKAAEVKAKFRCAYADAFAASLAISKRATLVTADPDFRKFGDKIRVNWLSSHKSVN